MEETGIYTPRQNLTVQIYVGSSDADLGTSDVRRKHYSREVKSPRVQVSVGTSDKHQDFRRSGLPTIVGTSDGHRQQVSRTNDAGTPGLGRDFRLLGVPTHVGTSDIHSHRAGCDWESALPARVMTSDCREFQLTSGLPTPTVTENYSMCS
jgi:hypothetical protein